MADSGLVDLRSDTVTRPTAAMRRAMAGAEVGDDLFGDDPTVIRLQEQAAALTGKQAALYLPTGTLCNQIALHALAGPGRVVVCEETAHVGTHELISSAMLSSITFRTIAGRSGLVTAAQVAAAVEPVPYDPAVVGLVAVENTHQVGGGTVLPVGALAEIAAVCAGHGVPLYLDGARIFNACTVTGAPVSDYAAQASAMMFCLSKGLGAPIGSVLAGDAAFIEEARRLKILFGAGWRQAGIMAAAGLIALAEGRGRLAEDHANARRLAEGIAAILPGHVDLGTVQTNIVFVDVAGTGQPLGAWAASLAAEGVLVTIVAGRIRMLTHVDVSEKDIDTALAAWGRVAKEAGLCPWRGATGRWCLLGGRHGRGLAVLWLRNGPRGGLGGLGGRGGCCRGLAFALGHHGCHIRIRQGGAVADGDELAHGGVAAQRRGEVGARQRGDRLQRARGELRAHHARRHGDPRHRLAQLGGRVLDAAGIGERRGGHRCGEAGGEQHRDHLGRLHRFVAAHGAHDDPVGGLLGDDADPADPGGPGQADIGQPREQRLGEQRVRAQVARDEQRCLGRGNGIGDGLVRLGVRERQQRHHHTGQAAVPAGQAVQRVLQVILAAAQVTDQHLGAGAGSGRHVRYPDRDLFALRPGRPGDGDHQRGAVGGQR
jgi:threonine aldolase